ncbi:hypothetical protein ACF08B_05215 [Streptomyces sp. NPDC015139]|uniref:hypothetical protein n=1 Tax=Streptomyces sp. NPDC015139 TaxID=3364942 RepID=UPI0036FA1033
MSTGASEGLPDGDEPDDPQQYREDRSTRKKVIEASARMAVAVAGAAIGQLVGDALAKLIGL